MDQNKPNSEQDDLIFDGLVTMSATLKSMHDALRAYLANSITWMDLLTRWDQALAYTTQPAVPNPQSESAPSITESPSPPPPEPSPPPSSGGDEPRLSPHKRRGRVRSSISRQR